MLKLLVKKQLAEVFRTYFYNAKTGKGRKTLGVIMMFLLFGVLMLGVMGGMFTFLSYTLCTGLSFVGAAWLYFVIMAGLAILLGAFGTVFSTYTGLYRAKDNDLLLSMPIPSATIVLSRLCTVYLMGVLYSSVVTLPALIVYAVTVECSATVLVSGVLFYMIITLIVMVLSCLLGWVVAAISVHVKNKTFVTVFASILGVGLYYFFYFKAQKMLQDLILHAEIYAEKIKGSAYYLYLFGSIATGKWLAALAFFAGTLLLTALVLTFVSKSFLKLTTSTGATPAQKRYRREKVKAKSLTRALLYKEWRRFISNANYILNCGLGLILGLILCGFLFVKGGEIAAVLDAVLIDIPGAPELLLAAAMCFLMGMIDPAAPSVSLEGKNLWILRSLPVSGKNVLFAKALLQFLLSLPLALVSGAVILFVFRGSVFCALLPLVYAAFFSLFCVAVSVKFVNLTWTNEIIPIKQSAAVFLALFVPWVFFVGAGVVYFLWGWVIGGALFAAILCAFFFATAALLFAWIRRGGGKAFDRLA